MEPVAIVTAFVAALYIVARGPLLLAPVATAAFYRHLLLTPERVRIFGGLLVLLAVALIVTARLARADHVGITILIEGFGWYAGAVAVWVAAAPGPWQRVLYSFWDGISDQRMLLRALGVFNIVVGIVFGVVAFSVR